MRQKISWTDGRKDGQTDRGKTVYPPPPPGSGGIKINPRVNITWGSQYHDTPAYPKSRVNMS